VSFLCAYFVLLKKISAASRAPRPNRVDKVDYNFGLWIIKDSFEEIDMATLHNNKNT